MSMKTAIKKILEQGHLPDQPYSFENRRILLLNRIALVATLITAIIVITHLLVGNVVQPKVVSLGFLITLPTIWFQSIRKYRLARNWFLIGFFLLLSAIFFHSVRLDLATNTEYVLVILIPLILIFLDGKTSLVATVGIMLCGTGYVIYRYNLSGVDYPKELNGLIINWLTTSVTVFFCMNFFKQSLMRANELIERDREKLAVANKTKNFLFGVISHDIRSPLNILKQYLLLDPSQRKDPDQFMMYQEGLTKKVDEIDQTLNDLLYWSKTQLQGITVNPTAFNQNEIIANVVSILREKAQEKQIELKIEDQYSGEIQFDQDHFKVIIRNLIQNAIKFTPTGGNIAVQTFQDNEYIHIAVEDNGRGMDAETLKNLQEGMIVESNLGTSGEVGTGLGLSLVKELIAKNNGRLMIESRLDEGTEIVIKLPVE